MGVKGCWTCRERKVRCDTLQPICGNCTKARRVCKGYGMQLSWPRDGDKKRSMIARDTRLTVDNHQTKAKRFLNLSAWDVLLSEELENERVAVIYLRTMEIPRPTYLSPNAIDGEQSHLLGFFNESRSLILGPTDEEPLAQFILRVAFSDPSDAMNPVLQGVFALASQQLHGSLQSFRYKRLVVTSIKESINQLDEKTLLHNLMGIMLLYHYELSLETNDKGNWVRYLGAVKNIVNKSPAMQKLIRQEYSIFLDWIYYHEALAEFTVRHWNKPYEGCGFAPTARAPRAIEGSCSKVEDSIGCPTDVLQLVVDTCRQAIVAPPSAVVDPNILIQHTRVLEQRISRAIGDYGPIHSEQSAASIDRHTMISDLHRIASLIYVNRAVHYVSRSDFRHNRLVREGILLLTEMRTCQNAWPLFIIACEAVDDDQRLAILDVFEQSQQERRRRSSHIHIIQHMVEAVWNQLDLYEGNNQVDFLNIFDAVIGGVPFVPPFA